MTSPAGESGRDGRGGGAVILLYHRVTALPRDPQLLCVRPERFARHMQLIRERARPISLRELVRMRQAGSIPPRSVAVTFDDGYADNLYQAAPVLVANNVPATVFVATGEPDRRGEFWWDELEALLLSCDAAGRESAAMPNRGCGPSRSDEMRIAQPFRAGSDGGCVLSPVGTIERQSSGALVPDFSRPYGTKGAGAADPPLKRWAILMASLRDAAHGEDHAVEDKAWNVLDTRPPSKRHAAYLELCALIRPLPVKQRAAAMAELRMAAGVEPAARSTHRRLNDDEVGRLARCPVVEIGAHTVTHPVLSALPADEQRREIHESRQRLERLTGMPVTSFSYPFGQRRDYTRDTVALVRQAGFEYACSNFPGRVTGDTAPFEFPRHLVRDWDGDEFARRLEGWLYE